MAPDILILLAKAAGIGLLLAVPVGPLSLLCLRRSLTLGMAAGLVTGMGVATADAFYASVAAFGLGAVASAVADASWPAQLGGLALIGLGLRDLLPRDVAVAPPSLAGHLGAYAAAVALTLANPATILTFAAVIVGLGLLPDLATSRDGAVFVLGVFLGSAAWWLALSSAAGMLGGRLPPGVIRWTRRLAGAALIAFGTYAILG